MPYTPTHDWTALNSQKDTVKTELATLVGMLEQNLTDLGAGADFTILKADHDSSERGHAAIVAALPPYLQDPVRFAYLCGWRLGAIQGLRWNTVNRETGVIVMERRTSKNREPWSLALVGELAAIIDRRFAVSPPAASEYVFTGPHGGRLGDFRRAWKAACKAAGVPGKLFHDMRRSFVRNAERAGISRSVVMKCTGHLTESIYRRYRIVDSADIADALMRTEAFVTKHAANVVPLRRVAQS